MKNGAKLNTYNRNEILAETGKSPAPDSTVVRLYVSVLMLRKSVCCQTAKKA